MGRVPRLRSLRRPTHIYCHAAVCAGGLDTWENQWLQRSAAHPWCGMRNMAALLGAGVMDRYPRLRIGVLEAGHGWLPFWMGRIDEHARSIPTALPDRR